MREIDLDTLMFFEGHQEALDIYMSLEELLYDTFPYLDCTCNPPGCVPAVVGIIVRRKDNKGY